MEIDLQTLQVLNGKISRRALKLVLGRVDNWEKPVVRNPCIKSRHCRKPVHYRVKTMEIVNDAAFRVQFMDGVSGDVHLDASALFGVFAPLKDPAFFRQAYIDHGAVTWPNGADLAPDAMYAEIRQHGVWRLT